MVDVTPVLTLLDEAARQLPAGPLPAVLDATLTAALRDAWQRGIHPAEQEQVVQRLDRLAALLHPEGPAAQTPLASEALRQALARLLEALGFARRLQALRVARGFSRPQLAQAAGVHRATVHRLETGALAPPAPEVVQRLADALDVDVKELHDTTRPAELPPELAAFQQARASRDRGDLEAHEVALLETILKAWRAFVAQGWVVAGPFDDELSSVAQTLLEKLRRSGNGPARGHWITLASRLGKMDDHQFVAWLQGATRLAREQGNGPS